MEETKKKENELAIWEEWNSYPKPWFDKRQKYGYQFIGEEPCSLEGLQKFAEAILDDNIRNLLGLTQEDVLRSMSACRFLRKKLGDYQSRFWGVVNPEYEGMKGEQVLEKRLLKAEEQEAKIMTKEIASLKGKLLRRMANVEETKEEIEKFARGLPGSTGASKVSLRGKIQRREEKLPKLEQDVEEHQHLLDYKMEQRVEKKRKIAELKKKIKK